MSLHQLIKQHNQKQSTLREKNDQQKKEAIKSMQDVSESLVEKVNGGVAEVFSNQHLLDAEAKQLQAQAGHFNKITQNWINMFESLDQALKELGDVENWSQQIEKDVDQVCESLEQATRETS